MVDRNDNNFRRIIRWGDYQNPLTKPTITDMSNNTKNIQKIILAIDTAPAAIPPKPNMAAIKATTKKIITNLSIIKILNE